MIYLNCAATSIARPPCVGEAVCAALTGAGSAARGAAGEDLAAARLVFDARCELARLFGFDHPERLVFTHNATLALNQAILGTVRRGDHVVATAYEHNSVLRPLSFLARERDVAVDIIPVEPTGALDMAAAERLITPGTRLVAISHASNLTGAVLPVARIARLAHDAGALVLVDAAQTAGALPVDWGELGADLLAFTGHKALMGPTGTGGLIVGPCVEVAPLVHGGTGVQSALDDQPDAYPEHLEAGTLNTAGIAGLAAAARFVASASPASIHGRLQGLRARLVEGLAAARAVRVLGAHDGMEHLATVALTVGDLDAALVSDRLACDFGIVTRSGLHCAPRAHEALGTRERGAVRLSMGYYTTEAEVDRAVSAVAAIAREGV